MYKEDGEKCSAWCTLVVVVFIVLAVVIVCSVLLPTWILSSFVDTFNSGQYLYKPNSFVSVFLVRLLCVWPPLQSQRRLNKDRPIDSQL